MSEYATPPDLPPRRLLSIVTPKPPIPPRPVARTTSRRKPVPAHDDILKDQPSHSPVVETQREHTDFIPSSSLPARSYQLQPAVTPTSREKEDVVFMHSISNPSRERSSRHRLGFGSRPERRKRWWIIGGVALLLVVVLVAVIAIVVSKNRSKSKPNLDNGGNPLSVQDGGVDIGQPGDIARYGTGSSDHFVLQMNRSTLVSRFDPIVSPGKVSSHVHRFYGTSLVDEIRRNASEAASLGKCSTTPVQDDHSQYWVPQLYSRSSVNGSLSLIPIRYHAAYYFQKASTGQAIHPFPDNYNIVAGNPFRREVDPDDMSQKGLWWQCFRGGGNDTSTPGFPQTACPGGLIQLVIMPSCWDGVVDPDADYSKHVAYPIDSPNGHICSADYPKKLMTVQFETNFAVGDYPFNGPGEISWVLANGDTTGYGIHGDFVNGWRPEVQQAIIDNCRYMNKTTGYPRANDVHNCPPLVPSIDLGATSRCRFQGQIINEDVGQKAPLQLLPGCNALWQGTGGKPSCPPGRQEGNEKLKTVDPEIWVRDEPYVL